MKRIVVSLILMIVLGTNVSYANTTEDVKQNIINQSNAMGVEPAIMLSIAKTESGFRQSARSKGGHIGVFQLSPQTAKTMGLNPYDLDENIKAGISYYKNMYNKLGSMELAVAAYNTGLGAIKRNNNKIPERAKPFVAKIMKDYKKYKDMGL